MKNTISKFFLWFYSNAIVFPLIQVLKSRVMTVEMTAKYIPKQKLLKRQHFSYIVSTFYYFVQQNLK